MSQRDEYCTVQKFTEKQFRGKKYKVRKCDIIKVEQHPNYHTTDQNEGDGSANEIDSPKHTEPEPETQSMQEDNTDGTDSIEENPEEIVPNETTGLRRSSRNRRLPRFLEENYVMHSDSD